ncbi:phage terminase small subunit [Acinetobacter baumannii]|uniref:phage terminase small subunit n=1 Tax=Acinetobacter TaxID=469 RepID=UPI000D6449E9|nr:MULTISPECIES: phage terminase small subunit [Acinetobacter]MCE6089827.1 terminase [Acinetobacter baumannii]MCE6126368.1 terminase [Acinetobacter baumannii]MCE6130104.1 terminase [Acinetobacter baumannii]MCZ3333864.1 phage terminase small subunit [Acinetobacter baumannii]MCZ3340339.1 phage terminase small subunit [Acinetobacter baumannii]
MNFARQHFRKHQAKAAAEQATEYGHMKNATAYELQLSQLNNDRARLKQIQSTENKIKLKAELLPIYAPYIDGILEAQTGVQDEIVTEMMIWNIDTSNFSRALQIAEYVLVHNLVLPDRFERTPACVITEEISAAFLKQLKTNVEIDIDVLKQLEILMTNPDLSEETLDMPDQVKAKMYLALGKSELRLITDKDKPDLVHTKAALDYLQKAVELDDKCGGRGDLNLVQKLYDKFAPNTNPTTETETNTGDVTASS